MGNGIYHLKGSTTRDEFKFWHKRKLKEDERGFWACDLDLVLIEKDEIKLNDDTVVKRAAVAAVIDFKRLRERLTFTEVITYNAIISEWGVPVFIIRSFVKISRARATLSDGTIVIVPILDQDNSFKSFTIDEYLGGDWRPQRVEYETRRILTGGSESDYWDWERELRDEANPKTVEDL